MKNLKLVDWRTGIVVITVIYIYVFIVWLIDSEWSFTSFITLIGISLVLCVGIPVGAIIFLSVLQKIHEDKVIDKKTGRAEDKVITKKTERVERLCFAAGIYQLPDICRCGFRGSTGDEMEAHFDECEIYTDQIMELIRGRNE